MCTLSEPMSNTRQPHNLIICVSSYILINESMSLIVSHKKPSVTHTAACAVMRELTGRRDKRHYPTVSQIIQPYNHVFHNITDPFKGCYILITTYLNSTLAGN